MHPSWTIPPIDPQQFKFSKVSWQIKNNQYVSKFDDRFVLRRKIRYYSFDKSALSSHSIPLVYKQLSDTNFVSLYAATNIWDDFAESYLAYVHTVLEEKPWEYYIYKGKKDFFEFKQPYSLRNLKVKKAILDDLFKNSI
jgi:hypothetical protein